MVVFLERLIVLKIVVVKLNFILNFLEKFEEILFIFIMINLVIKIKVRIEIYWVVLFVFYEFLLIFVRFFRNKIRLIIYVKFCFV